ncbi:hypothetical protein QYM36_014687 [Artemia franciscana]|uniref:Uncharacterized protein n=1 Tax=Artemia franciscana TaxID=6661 RepID=A0AA88H895_ARTSF|nr:hypothetical protein QYM36_014687 [Artemia franciscana]
MYSLEERQVHNWMKKGQAAHGTQRFPHLYARVRGRKCAKEKQSSSDKGVLGALLDSLSKLSNHYCRANASKLYFEPCFKSKSEAYAFYKESCVEKKQKLPSVMLFDDTFYQKNISIFSPKKDCCYTCVAHKKGNVTDEVWKEHVALKNKACDTRSVDRTTARMLLVSIRKISGLCYSF